MSAASAIKAGPTTATSATAELNGAQAACALAACSRHCSCVLPAARRLAATFHHAADTCLEVLMHTL
ncbi:hypothetical protein AB0M29_38835 [Streptomyces sp. NPDC051976]|uniref:hypothetical protein n=1 Tax=Streptomyces sp. NPDC051976 TaxID=3154947 RepID=UPI00342F69E8